MGRGIHPSPFLPRQSYLTNKMATKYYFLFEIAFFYSHVDINNVIYVENGGIHSVFASIH